MYSTIGMVMTGAKGQSLALRCALAPIAAACAMLAGCAHEPELPPVELTVTGDERGCRFEAERRLIAWGNLAEAETKLGEAAERWRGRSVTILAGPADAPYKCFGLAIHVLQKKLRDGRIGFISEPPPGPD